jgi:hypothetical protein
MHTFTLPQRLSKLTADHLLASILLYFLQLQIISFTKKEGTNLTDQFKWNKKYLPLLRNVLFATLIKHLSNFKAYPKNKMNRKTITVGNGNTK